MSKALMSRNRRHLKAIEQEMERYATEIREIWSKADSEDRETTPEERGEVEERLKSIETLKEQKTEAEAAIKVEDDVKRIGQGMGPADDGISNGDGSGEGSSGGLADLLRLSNGLAGVQVTSQKSIGEQFIESEGYKKVIGEFKDTGVSREFSTGSVEVGHKAGTLLEGGQGAGLNPVPQVIPGVQETLFQRLTVADLIAPGSATTSSIRYVVEGTATSGATGVAEGAAKPGSNLALSTRDETVTKIATSLTVSDEMLEDAAQVQSYINGRLQLFVQIEEERELLRGAGSNSNEIQGIIGRSGVNVYGRGTVDSNAVALFKVLNGTRGSSFLEPDAIIMHPDNWQTTRLATDSAGQFFGGGPFLGPYGGPQGPVSASGQITGAQDLLWNKAVVVTSAIGSGTALVGSFKQAAQFFRRGGLSVEASNGYQDYFLKNLVAIRAEERGALAVYRPAAFTVVSGLN